MAIYLKRHIKALHRASPFQFEMVPSSYVTVPSESWWDGSCRASSFIRSCEPAVKWPSWWNYTSLGGTLAFCLEWDLITQQKSSVALWNQYQARPSTRGCIICLNIPRKIFAAAQCFWLCTWDLSQYIFRCVCFDLQTNEWNICHFRNEGETIKSWMLISFYQLLGNMKLPMFLSTTELWC